MGDDHGDDSEEDYQSGRRSSVMKFAMIRHKFGHHGEFIRAVERFAEANPAFKLLLEGADINDHPSGNGRHVPVTKALYYLTMASPDLKAAFLDVPFVLGWAHDLLRSDVDRTSPASDTGRPKGGVVSPPGERLLLFWFVLLKWLDPGIELMHLCALCALCASFGACLHVGIPDG